MVVLGPLCLVTTVVSWWLKDGTTPVILLTVIYNRSRVETKWFIQKVVGTLVRPQRIQSLSVLIIHSTYLLALLLPMVM